jgi:hypothetical protein
MSKPLATPRIQGRALAARLFRVARKAVAGVDDSATGRAIAKRWEIDHANVDHWSDETSGVALTLGDLLAMPRPLALATLTGACAALSEGDDIPTRDTCDGIAILLGKALDGWRSDLADGREDEHARHAAALERIATIALRGAAACRRRAGAR